MEVETACVTSVLLTGLEVTKMAKLAAPPHTPIPEYLEKKYHPASNLL